MDEFKVKETIVDFIIIFSKDIGLKLCMQTYAFFML